MNIQIDINGSIKRTMETTTKFGTFWKGKEFPDGLGPAVSHLLVVGLLPAAGMLISSFLFWLAFLIKGWAPGFGFFFSQILFAPIAMYAFFVVMPPIMGMILAAVAPNISIDKGDANSYATILAYSVSPSAVASFAASILMGVFGFLFVVSGAFGIVGIFTLIASLISLAAAIITIMLIYNGYVQGLEMESGQAIIMIVIQFITYLLVWGIIFGIIAAIFGGGLMGPWSTLGSLSALSRF